MLVREGFKMALAAIGAHKLRSGLTLVGIVAGVAAIIAVMTGVSVIQNQMETELSVLGTRVFQVQKWPPQGFDNSERDFRKIQRYPALTLEHADLIREKVANVDLVGAELWLFSVRVSYRGEIHRTGQHDLRGDAGVPREQHPLRRVRAQHLERRRPGGSTGRGDRLQHRREPVPVHRSDRQGDQGRRSQGTPFRASSPSASRPWAATSTTTC